MAIVVKRRGKKEVFDEKKIYASVYAACKDVNMDEKRSEGVAQGVVAEVKLALKGRAEVNSTEIFGIIIQKLAKISEPAAFMYETHRDIPA